MAYSESQVRISLDADSSIGIYTGVPGGPGSASPNSGMQFRFVKVTGVHTAGLCTAATNEQPVGVLQNKPQYVGTGAEVAISGVSMIQVGSGGLTAGQIVKSDANGQGIAGTLGTDRALGIALDTAASGLCPVLLQMN